MAHSYTVSNKGGFRPRQFFQELPCSAPIAPTLCSKAPALLPTEKLSESSQLINEETEAHREVLSCPKLYSRPVAKPEHEVLLMVHALLQLCPGSLFEIHKTGNVQGFSYVFLEEYIVYTPPNKFCCFSSDSGYFLLLYVT